MEFNIDTARVAEGTVLLFGIRYPGSNEGRVYTYTMIKAGGMWYVSGGARSPQAAGWGAVKNWLTKDGRQVVYVKVATEFRQLWPKPDDLPAAHEFAPGLSGRVCVAMVTGPDGTGDSCGKTPVHDIHRRWWDTWNQAGQVEP